MKNILVTSILSVSLIVLSTVSYANFGNNNNQAKCPGVSAIASAGLSEAEQLAKQWVVGQISKFDMDKEWAFVIGFFEANDKEDALKKGTEALSTLKYKSGPTPMGDKTACLYSIDLAGPQVHAVAITPPFTDMPSLLSS